MNVLILCEDIEGKNGWGTYTRDLVRGLRDKGHSVRVAVRSEGFLPMLPRPLLLMAHPWLARFCARRLARLLGLVKPDVIHITVEPYAMLVPHLPAEWRKKTVLTVHGTYGVQPVTNPALRKKAAAYYDAIPRFIAVSGYTKQKVAEALAAHVSPDAAARFSERTAVIHNAITLPAMPPAHAENAVKRILLVGGVKKRKGVLQALRGCAAYRDAYKTPFHFTAVGSVQDDGGYLQTLRTEMTALRMEGNVTFAGKVEDKVLEELYAGADAYLMPSETTPESFEGFGLVFLEANARGVPVIGPDDSGSAEAIAEGRSGYRVDIDDPQMIADRLRKILDDKTIAREACRAWAEEHAVDRMVPKVEEIYENLAA